MLLEKSPQPLYSVSDLGGIHRGRGKKTHTAVIGRFDLNHWKSINIEFPCCNFQVIFKAELLCCSSEVLWKIFYKDLLQM